MQDTNQPPHPANNDYAVKVIQDKIGDLSVYSGEITYINRSARIRNEVKIEVLNELLEKLKS